MLSSARLSEFLGRLSGSIGRNRSAWPAAIAGFVIAACSGGTEPTPVTTIRVSPSPTISAVPGDTIDLEAQAVDADGRTVSGVPFSWRSSDGAIATVSSNGRMIAIHAGDATISVSAQGAESSVGVHVATGISQVAVSPASRTLTVGERVTLTANATSAAGTPIGADEIRWSSSDTLVLSVRATGEVTAIAPGSASAIAAVDGHTGSAAIRVVAAVASVEVDNGMAQLFVGDSLRLTAVLRDSAGLPIGSADVTWSSSDPALATVTQGGTVVAIAPGAVDITAASGAASFAIHLVITRHVASIALAPAVLTLRTGDTATVTAALSDGFGNALTDRVVAWSSSNPALAAVSNEGQVTAIRAGSATITATVEGRSAGVPVTVAARVARVTLSSALTDLTAGGQIQVNAVVTDSDGNVLSGREISWETHDAFVASVTSSGHVTALFEGTTVVEARSEGIEGELEIRVRARTDSIATLVGAGDIGTCSGDGDEATARLLDQIPGVVFTTGDNVYNDGTAEEFANCYGPTWGRHKARTLPVAGNHEYNTPGATGYYDYFGAAAGDPSKGYYSYEVGAWHVVVLNSNISTKASSAQGIWLAADLDAHPAACTVAMWHHPLFSTDSGSNRTRDAWQTLANHGAELVLTGHQHNYQRYAPQTAGGLADPLGIREFVVGTGGRSLGGAKQTPTANNEMYYTGGYGVLKLTLHPNSYEWEFISEAGKTFTDSGQADCH